MATETVCNVQDVDPSVRAVLERLLGRSLSEGQKVVLTVVDLKELTPEERRDAAWRTIHAVIDEAVEKTKGLESQELDESVEEAMRQARPRHAS
jgi:hypothetical protein